MELQRNFKSRTVPEFGSLSIGRLTHERPKTSMPRHIEPVSLLPLTIALAALHVGNSLATT
jgi:hypothetical protein